MLRASQPLKWFGRRSNAYHQCAPARCGFANGVSRNAGKVGFGAVCWEQNDVVCLIADDYLEIGGEVWIAADPRAKLRVGGYDRFIGTVFFTEWQMGCARVVFKKHIWAGQGFVLCQTQIAVLGVDEKKCLVR